MTDDSSAIQRALDSGPQSLKFSKRTYGLGQPVIVNSPINSEAGATLQALQPGLTGLLFPNGASGMMQLPILSGFAIAIQTYGGVSDQESKTPHCFPGTCCLQGSGAVDVGRRVEVWS